MAHFALCVNVLRHKVPDSYAFDWMETFGKG